MVKEMTEGRRRPAVELWGAIWVGVLIMGIGILFYLDNQNIIEFFPGILILVGILILIGGIIRWASGAR